MARTTLNIDGMSCGHCVASVNDALREADGVAVATVALGTATVEFDPTTTSPEKIADAVSKAGYPARVTD